MQNLTLLHQARVSLPVNKGGIGHTLLSLIVGDGALVWLQIYKPRNIVTTAACYQSARALLPPNNNLFLSLYTTLYAIMHLRKSEIFQSKYTRRKKNLVTQLQK